MKRRARVSLIAYDPASGGHRVQFHVPRLRRGDEWSAVKTDPAQDVRRTRIHGKQIELVLFDAPPWDVGDEVTLILEPR